MKTAARRLAMSAALAMTTVVAAPFAAHADDIPNPKPELPSGVTDKTNIALNLLMGLGIVVVVAGFIMAGIAMAWTKRGGHGGNEAIEKLWYVAGGAIVIGSASALTGIFF